MELRDITDKEKATLNPEKTKVLIVRGIKMLLNDKELNELASLVNNNCDKSNVIKPLVCPACDGDDIKEQKPFYCGDCGTELTAN